MSGISAEPLRDHAQESKSPRNDEYFQKVKAIYRSKTYRDKQTRNTSHHNTGTSSRNTDSVHILPDSSESKNKNNLFDRDQLSKSNQQSSQLINSKLRTQNIQLSPPKFKFYPNKAERQRKFHTNIENDRMVKRIYEIKSRQNKYIKESKRLMQLANQHKIMHESSVLANKRLLKKQIQQKNDKFIDRLFERVKHKQMIKPQGSQKFTKCIRLQESRARLALGLRSGTVQLPPMIFQ